MALSWLERSRVVRAKRAFSTRRVPDGVICSLLRGQIRPQPGDLVLARVDQLGKHTKLELTDGRRAHMFPGDEIIVAYGNRYAPDQYEAVIGNDLSPCDLVAAGGIASIELSRHGKMLPSTKITPLGLLGDASGKRLNLKQFAINASTSLPAIPIILSLGTSMNAGKTLTATSIIRGLRRHAYKVAALKITGTGAGGDMWIVRDAGADVVADFTDAGFASTYLATIPELEQACYRLLNHVAAAGCDIAVVEIADGLQQLETAALIRSEAIKAVTLGTMFAAYDAMGAKCGADILGKAGHHLLGLSGRLGLSPLGVREAENATGLRFFSPWELQEGGLVPAIRRRAADQYSASGGAQRYLRAIAEMSAPERARWHAMSDKLPTTANLTSAEGAEPKPPHVELLATVADHIMAIEVAERCGADFGDRNPGRKNRRNGFRQMVWQNPVSPIVLNVPRLRQGNYEPSFLADSANPSISVSIDTAINSLGSPALTDALERLVTAISGRSATNFNLEVLGLAVAKLAQATRGAPPAVEGLVNWPAQTSYADGAQAEENELAFANSFQKDGLPVVRMSELSDPSEDPTFDVHLLQGGE